MVKKKITLLRRLGLNAYRADSESLVTSPAAAAAAAAAAGEDEKEEEEEDSVAGKTFNATSIKAMCVQALKYSQSIKRSKTKPNQ